MWQYSTWDHAEVRLPTDQDLGEQGLSITLFVQKAGNQGGRIAVGDVMENDESQDTSKKSNSNLLSETFESTTKVNKAVY